MKTIKYLLPLCCVVVASCGESSIDTPTLETPSGKTTVLTAIIGAETKTVMGEKEGNSYPISWSDGDMINVNGESSKAVSLEVDSKTASFEFESELSTPYSAVYPSSAYKGAGVITIPSKQTYKQGSFDASSAVMLSYATEGTSLTFHHVMSYLKLSFGTTAGTTALEKVMKVEVSSNGTESMSGDFSVDFENNAITPAEGNESSVITVNCGTAGVDLGSEIIVAIPAQNYASGLVITTYDKVGNKSVYTANSGFEAVAGKVYPMPIQMELYPGTILKAVKVGDLYWAPVYCGYSESYPNGLLYQYGRMVGQPYYPAATTSSICASGPIDNPEDDKFYKNGADSYNDWYSGSTLTTWPMSSSEASYVEGKIANPCPSGWRLPTITECNVLIGKGFTQSTNWSFEANDKLYTDEKNEAMVVKTGFALNDESGLFLAAVGGRTRKGQSYYRGSGKDAYARMWISDIKTGTADGKASCLSLRRKGTSNEANGFTAEILALEKATGISVRCVKEVE